jgi:hypothetical protein
MVINSFNIMIFSKS